MATQLCWIHNESRNILARLNQCSICQKSSGVVWAVSSSPPAMGPGDAVSPSPTGVRWIFFFRSVLYFLANFIPQKTLFWVTSEGVVLNQWVLNPPSPLQIEHWFKSMFHAEFTRAVSRHSKCRWSIVSTSMSFHSLFRRRCRNSVCPRSRRCRPPCRLSWRRVECHVC